MRAFLVSVIPVLSAQSALAAVTLWRPAANQRVAPRPQRGPCVTIGASPIPLPGDPVRTGTVRAPSQTMAGCAREGVEPGNEACA